MRIRCTRHLLLALPFLAALAATSHAQKTQVPKSHARPVVVLRYVDPLTNRHALTTDAAAESPIAHRYQRESVVEGTADSPLFYLASTPLPGMVPLYRLRTPDGSMRFTADPMERAQMKARGHQEVAGATYVYAAPAEGAYEIFQLENAENGDVLYTTSRKEKSYLLGHGWTQKPSVGYTQPTSSSGTGHLNHGVVKLEDADFALLAGRAGHGERLEFTATNTKIAHLAVGTKLYAPAKTGIDANGNPLLRPGFMRTITALKRNGAGLEITTRQANYTEIFSDFRLFLNNRPVAWHKSDSPSAASHIELQAPPSVHRSFDGLPEFHQPEYINAGVRPDESYGPGGCGYEDTCNCLNDPDDFSCGGTSISATLAFNGDVNPSDPTNDATFSGSFTIGVAAEYDVGCATTDTTLFIPDNWECDGTVLFSPFLQAQATASVAVATTLTTPDIKLFGEEDDFLIGEIPVTLAFEIDAGAAVTGTATASISASAGAHGSGGLGLSGGFGVVDGLTINATPIGCPNPCPPDFACGGTASGYSGSGPTCSLTANATTSFNVTANNVQAWVTPKLSLGPGFTLDGVGLSLTAEFALKNTLEADITPTEVDGFWDLTPTIGTDANLGIGIISWSIPIAEVELGEIKEPIFTLPLGGGTPSSLVVNTTADDAGTASNCTSNPTASGPGNCSLRDALLEAASLSSGAITFDPTVFATAQTITLSNGTLNIPSSTSVTGPATGSGATLTNAVTVTLSTGPAFTVASGVTGASLSGLNITNSGQGISNAGTLTVANSNFFSDSNSTGSGGGISNSGTLTVTGSTFTNDGANTNGAGIDSSGTLTVANSTFSGNTAQGSGGGIDVEATGTATVTNSTFSSNSAVSGNGGGIDNSGSSTLNNSIFFGNNTQGGGRGGGVMDENSKVTAGNNVFFTNFAFGAESDCQGCASNNNPVTADPMLALLSSNGGVTQTLLQQPGSAAICAGSLTFATAAGLTTDQRGNKFDPSCPTGSVDAGAVQSNYALAFDAAGQPSGVNAGAALSPAALVDVTESGSPYTTAPATVSITDTASDLTTSPATASTSIANGQASFGSLIFTAAEASDTLTATLALNSSVNITATSSSFAVAASTLAPGISVSTTALAFGNQRVGTNSSVQQFTITNTGNAQLTFSGAFAGPNANEFSKWSNCYPSPAVLAPGAFCTVTAYFNPTVSGPAQAQITFTDNASGTQPSVTFTGTGTAPVVGLSVTSLDFGSQNAGSTSPAQQVVLTNNGNSQLNFSGAITGTNPGSFSKWSNCGGPLAPSASCTINVVFKPTASGAASAALTFTSNAAGPLQSVPLTGTGLGANLSLSQTGLAFGNQKPNTASAAQLVTITNTGNLGLAFSGTITGTNSNLFTKWSNCAGPLAPGASCTVTVVFKPTAMGAATAALTFTDNASNSPQSVNLTGAGAASVLSLSVTGLTFGNQNVGSTSAAHQVVITNTGNSQLNFNGAITGTDAGSFTKWSNCSGPLAPSASCTVNVFFKPSAAGAAQAAITFTDNAINSPQSVTLSGTGQ